MGDDLDDDDSLESMLDDALEDDPEKLFDEGPVVDFVNAILCDAIKRDATEVHFDPHSEGLLVRIRHAGGKPLSRIVPEIRSSPVVIRLKILGQIDIAERERPQDGRFRLKAAGRVVDCFVATLPTTRGERVIVRMTVKAVQPPRLGERGTPIEVITAVGNALRKKCGLLLVGSSPGDRTDLLAALLLEIDTAERIAAFVSQRQVIHDERVLAVQTKDIVGFNITAAMRATARQHADVIFVDQTLPAPDLELALALASEDRVVVVAVAADTPSAALLRIIELGLDPEDIADSLRLVVTEKRYGRLCPECRRQSGGAWEAPGCTRCIGGRMGEVYLYRLLENDDALIGLLRNGDALEQSLVEEDERRASQSRERLNALIASGDVAACDVEEA